MNRLLQHFKTLTTHPKNAQELKGLILQLAIQGKLTKQWRSENPEVEPATVLLERIAAEKAQLTKDKKIRKEKPLLPISESNIPFEIPIKWVWSKLGEVSTLINGDRGKNYPSKAHYISEGIPFITARNLGERYLKHDSLNYISQERFDLLRSGQILKNDILYCLRGSLGKCSIVEGIDEGAIASSLVIIRNSSLVDSVFMLNYFSCPLGQQMIYKYDNGTAQPNLSATDVKEYFLPLPPLEEQKAIVKVANQLFEEIEALERETKARIQLKADYVTSALEQLAKGNTAQEWTKLQAQFSSFFTEKSAVKKLRESILQLAVQGKLTRNWRTQSQAESTSTPLSVTTASELLEQIKAEKEALIKAKKIKQEKPLAPILSKEIPYELPESWVWCRMQEIGLFERGKSKHRPRNDFRLFEDGKYPLVQTGDVSAAKKNGGIIKTHKSVYNEFGLAQSRIWNKGTLCITIAANIAETGILGFDACFPDSVVGFTDLLKSDTSRYVEYFITVMKSDLEKYAPSTAQKNINLGILYELKFPFPPLEEQKAIVEKVNTLMALCDELEAAIEQNTTQVEQLMQSCLREVLENKPKSRAEQDLENIRMSLVAEEK